MKKLLLVMLAALFMFTSCELEEDASDYVGTWENVTIETYNGATVTSTTTLTFTETTFTVTSMFAMEGDADTIAELIFYMGGEAGTTSMTTSGRGTVIVSSDQMTTTVTHMTLGGVETAITGESAKPAVATFSISGSELTIISQELNDDDVLEAVTTIYTKK